MEMARVDKNHICEVRTFPKPPADVKTVMTAVLLLLGEDEHTASNWAYCMRTMNPTGKFNFLRRITNFDVGNVHADIITRARHLLVPTSHDRLMAVSFSAAAFYSWAMEVTEGHENIDGKFASVDRQRQLLGKPNRNALPIN